MIIKSGQSIIEVVIATSLISIGIIAALSLTNQSQKSSNYAKMLDTANSYNNQLADYFRNQKSLLGWASISEKVAIDAEGGVATYCYSSLIENEDFLTKSAGTCAEDDYLGSTQFIRQIEINANSINSGTLPITIITSWTDKSTRSATLNLELTQWK